MKVIQYLCESFNRYDPNIIISPFDQWDWQYNFSMRPAYSSVAAMEMIQQGHCRPYRNRHRKGCIFREGREYLGTQVKQRIISSSWPTYCNVNLFADHSNMNDNRGQYLLHTETERYLRSDFYKSQTQHLIVWGRVGHVGIRHPEESKGVPVAMPKTFIQNQKWIQDWILPHTKDGTLVLCHPDHGSARKGLSAERAMFDGFVFSNIPIRQINNYNDVRKLILDAVADRDISR